MSFAGGAVAPALRGRRLGVFLLSLVVPILFLAVGIAARDDFGETWDEQFDQDIGRFYYRDWSRLGPKGLEERFIPLQRYYGPAFDVVVVAAHDVLCNRLKVVSNPVAAYHMPVLLAASLTLWLVFWLGRRFWGTWPGLFASAALAVMPQFVAHSQNNLKDTPLMAFFTLSIFLMYEAVRRSSLPLFLLAGVATGLTYSIKLHGLFVFILVVLWQLVEIRLDWKRWGRLLLGLSASGAAAVATVLAVWPYYRDHPIARFRETLETFARHWYNEYVFYLGEHFRAHEVPWHFPFVMLGVNTPIIHLIFLLAALGSLLFLLLRRRPGTSPSVLLALWLFVPPGIQIVTGAVKLDGVRHYLLVLPAMALLIGWAIAEGGRLAARLGGGRRGPAWLYGAAVAIPFLLVLKKDVEIHPYQGVFFNRLAGGTRGARDRFELDYWGQSFQEAARWMNLNLPEGSRIWLTVPAQHFLKIDRTRLRFVPDASRRPNYKVNLIRGILKTGDSEEDYLHPKRRPVWAVTVDGANLLEIFEYPENRDVPGGTLLPPLPVEPKGPEPGVTVRELGDAGEKGPPGAADVWQSLAFDCDENPYRNRPVSLVASGFLRVAETGAYDFEIFSDDDAVLFLGDRSILTNASMATSRATVRLRQGAYRLRLEYRNDVGPACLKVSWGRGAALRVLAAPDLFHERLPGS